MFGTRAEIRSPSRLALSSPTAIRCRASSGKPKDPTGPGEKWTRRPYGGVASCPLAGNPPLLGGGHSRRLLRAGESRAVARHAVPARHRRTAARARLRGRGPHQATDHHGSRKVSRCCARVSLEVLQANHDRERSICELTVLHSACCRHPPAGSLSVPRT
jgi:hypothetical protein